MKALPLLLLLLLTVAGCPRSHPDAGRVEAASGQRPAADSGDPAPGGGSPAAGDSSDPDLPAPPAPPGPPSGGDSGGDSGNVSDGGVPSGAAAPCPGDEPVWLVDVVDGDTIDVAVEDGSLERVRYIGMDTPERGQPCYAEATRANEDLLRDGDTLRGADLTLARDVSERDRYHRLLRYVCNAGGEFVNARLVADGYARPLRYWPDVRYASVFKSLYQEAMQARRGCLGQLPEADSDPAGTGCCRVCRNGQACGDACIGWQQTCHRPPGCACQG